MRGILLCLLTVVAGGGAEVSEWQQRLDEGGRLHDVGRYREASELLRKGLRQAESDGAGLKVTAQFLTAAGAEYHELGMDTEATRFFLKALHQVEELHGRRSRAYALQLSNLAAIDIAHQRFKEAEHRLREAISIYAALDEPDDVALAIARCGLGQVLVERHALEEADTAVEQSRAEFEKWGKHERLAVAINNQAAVRRAQGRLAEATAMIEKSLQILEEVAGKEHPHLVQAIANLAVMYEQTGRWKDADAAYRRAIVLGEATLGPEHPAYGRLLLTYAEFLRDRGRKPEARTFEARAREALRAAARRNGDGFTVDVAAFRQR